MTTITVTPDNKKEMMKKYHFIRHYGNSSIRAISKQKRTSVTEKSSYVHLKSPSGKDDNRLILKKYKVVPKGTYLVVN